jgi:hypothetical protein
MEDVFLDVGVVQAGLLKTTLELLAGNLTVAQKFRVT